MKKVTLMKKAQGWHVQPVLLTLRAVEASMGSCCCRQLATKLSPGWLDRWKLSDLRPCCTSALLLGTGLLLLLPVGDDAYTSLREGGRACERLNASAR
uniref:Uncharacterized protein n=1 Tax=Oryza brachyantha TaxID=4533 RepID=J3KZ88_ORYBR